MNKGELTMWESQSNMKPFKIKDAESHLLPESLPFITGAQQVHKHCSEGKQDFKDPLR